MKEIFVEKDSDGGVIASCGPRWAATGPDAGSAIFRLLAIHPEIFPPGLEYHVYGRDCIVRIVGHPDRYEIARNGWGDAVMALIIRFGADMGIRVKQKVPAASPTA